MERLGGRGARKAAVGAKIDQAAALRPGCVKFMRQGVTVVAVVKHIGESMYDEGGIA